MRKFALSLWMVLVCLTASAQTDVFTLMKRTDLRLSDIERIANRYFDSVGTGRATGYTQYQHWLYERKFHVDDKGYLIDAETESAHYRAAKAGMPGRQWPSAARGTSGTWVELGPTTWNNTSGWSPGNGSVTSIAVHPRDPEILYVSSAGGGIWKSWNRGTTWMPLTDFISSAWMHIRHITIDPSIPINLFAVVEGGGIIKSTNDGLNWSATGPGPIIPEKVLVHPTNSAIVFAIANNGIFRSTNHGTTWTQVHAQAKDDIEFNPADPNIMYASGHIGTSSFWRSSNNGITWSPRLDDEEISGKERTLIGVTPANPNVVYVVQASNGTFSHIFGRMYKSTDSGIFFGITAVGDPDNSTNYFGFETNGRGIVGRPNYAMSICVNPFNANEVMIAAAICWKSTDGGFFFEPKTAMNYPNQYGYNHSDVHALEWIGSTIYSGSDGGIYKSTNGGGDWTDLSVGLGIKQFYRIASSKTDPNVIIGGAQNVGNSFRRSDGTWVDWTGGNGKDNAISPTNPNIAFGTAEFGIIYKTTDAGQTMVNLGKPPGGSWVTPIVMHPTDHNIIYGGWLGIYKSVTGGDNWINISGNVITSSLNALAVAPTNTQYIYGSVGNILYATSNGGASWSSVTAPAEINSIFVSPVNPEKIYLACNHTTNRVFVSADMGRSFSNISAGLPALPARSIVVDDNATESMYVGMNVGVYYRDNVDTNWVEHANGLPLVAVNEVEIQKSSRKLRVATYGRGIWETSLWDPILEGTTDITDDGGVITARHMTGSPPNEDITKVIDNRNNTKYQTFNCFGWVRYSAANTWVPQGYSIVSANDHQERDPKSWTLMASLDSVRWVVLHAVTDEVFSSRGQEKMYTFNNTAAFKYYTLHFSCKSGSIFQMAELRIFGVQQPATLTRTANPTDNMVVTSPEELQASGIKVFPNPVSGKLTITGLQHAHTVILYDINGKKIMTQKVSGHSKELDMQKLKTGMYQLIIINKAQKQTTIKVMKQ